MAHLEHKEISGESGLEEMTVLARVKDWYLSGFLWKQVLLVCAFTKGDMYRVRGTYFCSEDTDTALL